MLFLKNWYLKMSSTSLSLEHCPLCNSNHFFGPAERQEVRDSLSSQLQSLWKPQHWMDEVVSYQYQYNQNAVIGELYASTLTHEHCGIALSQLESLMVGAIVDRELVVWKISTESFVKGGSSTVHHAYSLLKGQPVMACKKSMQASSTIDKIRAQQMSLDVQYEYVWLKTFHNDPSYTALRDVIIDCPKVIFNELYEFEGETLFTSGHISTRYESFLKKISDFTLDVVSRWQFCARVIDIVYTCHMNFFALCDIKPSNFLISPEGKVVVGDIASFRIQGDQRWPTYTANYLTKVDAILITNLEKSFDKSSVMPEEKAERKFELEKYMDISALAITCFAILTGRIPFRVISKSFCQPSETFDRQYACLKEMGSAGYFDLFIRMISRDRPSITEVREQFQVALIQLPEVSSIRSMEIIQ
jgi:serine/threonine protein kinase